MDINFKKGLSEQKTLEKENKKEYNLRTKI